MSENWGELGNIEIYVFLKEHSFEVYNCLQQAIGTYPVSILRNIWDLNIIGEEINFSESLFKKNLSVKEEILFQYLINDNLITIILLHNRIVVRISFKPWHNLEISLNDLLSYLLNKFELMVIGFELDFDYENENLKTSIHSLSATKSNFPFIIKEPSKNYLEYIGKDNLNIKIDEFLKSKVQKILISIN